MKAWYEFCQKEYSLSASFDEAKSGIYAWMNQKYETSVELKPGALDMLNSLKNHGVKMCLATATDRQTVEMILNRLGISHFFSRIFTSGEVGVGKREPKIYEVALEYLGTDRETTYVFEDAAYALKTAFSNNFHTRYFSRLVLSFLHRSTSRCLSSDTSGTDISASRIGAYITSVPLSVYGTKITSLTPHYSTTHTLLQYFNKYLYCY